MRGVHRMLLHAWCLRFIPPDSGDAKEVVAPLDAEFNKALELFDWSLNKMALENTDSILRTAPDDLCTTK